MDQMIRLEMNPPVAHLLLDDPSRKVNTLNHQVFLELNEALDSLASDPSVKALVIRSAKPGVFLAGADLRELKNLAGSPSKVREGYQAARTGQELMDKIGKFPKPVVAAINGACMGGGLELALACTARVAAKDPSTQLGLPELKLGIIPGFGGTYRLPRLIGLVRAVEAILSSRTYGARQALKLGLVDDICEPEQLARVSQETALGLAEGRLGEKFAKRRKKALPWYLRALQLPILRRIFFQLAIRQVLKKTRGRYPAPLRLIRLLSESYGGDGEKHLEAEALALADTLATPQAENLVRLFLASQDAKRPGSLAREIKAVGIVGSGLMGSGIAVNLIHKAEVEVSLKDTDLKMLGKALKKTWDFLEKRSKRGEMDHAEALRRFHRLSTSTGLEGFQNLDFVIEAVPEILDLKRKIFAEVEGAVSPGAVLASNTSSLKVSDLSALASRPERFVGMHFFSPAEVMPLVEVVRGPKTLPEAVERTVALALKMGKIPIVVKDTPGFLVNRILLSYALESALMVQEGVPVSRVDGAALSFGMPMGPIRLIGEVGIEVMRTVIRRIQEAYGDRFPSPSWLNREDLRMAFRKGKDGKWKADGKLIDGWTGSPDPGLSAKEIQDRFFQAMLGESVRCLEENVVETPELLDLAMVYGMGFPPEKGGPLREADARGLEILVNRGREYSKKFGARFEPPALLVQKMETRGSFTRGASEQG